MANYSQKQIIYKLYDRDNDFIRVLDNVEENLSIEKGVGEGSGPLSLNLQEKIDALPDDIQINNKIKIFIQNKWNDNPRLAYYGYITGVEPNFEQGDERVNITCLGAPSKLQNDFLRMGNDLAYEIMSKQVDLHVKDIITHYRDVINSNHGSYARSMIDDPNNYWDDTNYIEDTSEFGNIPYRYFRKKHKEAINDIFKFLPKNDEQDNYWYWYLNDEGRIILKSLSTEPDHTLYLSKHIETSNINKNIEEVQNRIYFWNERGDFADEMVRKVFQDDESVDKYDVIAGELTDTDVTTQTQGQLLGDAHLQDHKDKDYAVEMVVNEAEYDILSFNLGDVIRVLDIKDNDVFKDRMMIKSMTIEQERVRLSLERPTPEISTQIEKDRKYIENQLKWFGEVLTKIDGTRIHTGVQHWTSEGVEFSSTSDSVSWTAGRFVLPNDVRREVDSGSIDNMTADQDYYMYVDEKNRWSTKDTGEAAQESGTVDVFEGENYLTDSSKSWDSNEWKGYVLWANLADGARKFTINSNTSNTLTLDEDFEDDETDVAYEIHKFKMRKAEAKQDSGTATGGSTTTLEDTDRTENSDFWNGYELRISSGANAGYKRTIDSFDGTTFTFEELPEPISSGDRYSVTLNTESQIVISKSVTNSNTEDDAFTETERGEIDDSVSEGSWRAYNGFNSSSQLIKDVVNDKLDTASQTILSEFDFESTDYAGAVRAGDLTWDSSGNLTSGSGVALYAGGIVGASDGDPTFTIDADTGDATFYGTVAASAIISAEISADQITSGILQGILIRTSESGGRVVLDDENDSIRIYDDDNYDRVVITKGVIDFKSADDTPTLTSLYGLSTTDFSGLVINNNDADNIVVITNTMFDIRNRDLEVANTINEKEHRVAKIHVGTTAPPENDDSWLWIDTS